MTLCSNALKTAHGNIAKVKDKASGFENFIVKLKDKAWELEIFHRKAFEDESCEGGILSCEVTSDKMLSMILRSGFDHLTYLATKCYSTHNNPSCYV